MFDIKENLKRLPDKPGVYLHKDKDGNIIYVGKAISLKNRVRQYFQSSSRLDPKVRALVSHISEFEYIITETEMEALILENKLIKQYMPKYNVLLRDDKTFPYIKVTLQDEWPRLIKTRKVTDDGSVYFGPYTDASAVVQIIDLLSSILGLKRCATVNFPEDWKPCLNYHIKQCKGICTGEVDKEAYKLNVRKAIEFLNGDNQGVKAYLQDRMRQEAENMNFERAAEYRDQLAAVEAVPDQAKLNDFLSAVKRNKVKVIRRRAEELARKETEKKEALKKAWESVGLSDIKRIEAYDISHLAGTEAVGAMVVFQEEKPEKKSYRRFRIKTASGSGDTDSLQEVVYRRMKRGLEKSPGFDIMPDLLLIDGGRNQVSAVEKVLLALNINIPVAGMIKDERHRTRSLLYNDKEVKRTENRVLLKYIASIQQEVHRFAIEYHRRARSKKLKKSVLDDIPGIGEKRKEALLNYFGNIQAIAEADADELRKIPGMNKTAAESIKKHLNNSIVKKQL